MEATIFNSTPQFLKEEEEVFAELLQSSSDLLNQSFFTNSTSSGSSNFTLVESALIIIAGTLLSVCTVGANLMVLVSFKMDRQLQTISNYFLFSLACADLTIGALSCPLMTLYTVQGDWTLGYTACKFWLSIDYLMSNASVQNLMVISLDRYCSVRYPLKYRPQRTRRRVIMVILSTYLISLVLWVPWIIAWPYIDVGSVGPETTCVIEFFNNPIVTVATAIAAFYLPVFVMIGLYSRVYMETQRRQKDIQKLQGFHQRSVNLKQSKTFNTGHQAKTKYRERGDLPSISSTTNFSGAVPTTPMISSVEPLCSNNNHCNNITPSLKHSLSVRSNPELPTSTKLRLNLEAEDESGFSDEYCGSPNPAILMDLVPPTPSYDLPLNHTNSNYSFGFDADQLRHYGATTEPDSGERKEKRDCVHSNGINRASLSLNEAPPTPSSPRCPPVNHRVTPQTPIPSSSVNNNKVLTTTNIVSHLTPNNFVTTMLSPNADRKSLTSLNSQSTPTSKLTSQLSRRSAENKRQESKAAKTLSAILLAFIITWTPYNILVIMSAFSYEIPKSLWDLSYYLCYLNSTINPICYALCNRNFRRTYVRILTCKWRSNRRRPTF